MKAHKIFFDKYRELYRPYINKVNEYLDRHQLYSAQWGVMKVIMSNDSITLGEIAKQQNVEKPTITRIIQKLIELDYIEVVRGEDKREKRIQLTELGNRVAAEVYESVEEFQVKALDGVTREEQLQASRVLEKVKENLLK